jgi:hypothetical protein
MNIEAIDRSITAQTHGWWRSLPEGVRQPVELIGGMLLLLGSVGVALYAAGWLLTRFSIPVRWGIVGFAFGLLGGWVARQSRVDRLEGQLREVRRTEILVELGLKT